MKKIKGKKERRRNRSDTEPTCLSIMCVFLEAPEHTSLLGIIFSTARAMPSLHLIARAELKLKKEEKMKRFFFLLRARDTHCFQPLSRHTPLEILFPLANKLLQSRRTVMEEENGEKREREKEKLQKRQKERGKER
jgi:hypothetical protein